ncbi:unnamed protein product [Adineta ricciae]|uniref:Uncharacterized protein n=1 Tax=Adineta ricciae TaxID=249248 RepID=A0A815VC04_ADIRI|nr:unnamed protein product [Adineta ricciae]
MSKSRKYSITSIIVSTRSGITLIWFEDSELWSSHESDETVTRLSALKNCFISRYATGSKCIKYLKRAQSYETIILVIVADDKQIDLHTPSTDAIDVSRIFQYRSVQSIFLVLRIANKVTGTIEANSFKTSYKTIDKLTGILDNHEAVYSQLQRLISEIEESDDGLFSTFNQRQKSLRHVRYELGAFVWSHSYRGQFSYLQNFKVSIK